MSSKNEPASSTSRRPLTPLWLALVALGTLAWLGSPTWPGSNSDGSDGSSLARALSQSPFSFASLGSARVASAPVACGSTNPPLALAMLHIGDGPAIVGLHDTPGDDPEAQRTLATTVQVGAVFGLAWDDERGSLYASAYHKRGVPFGPGGPGAIYRVDPLGGEPEVFATLPVGPDRHNLASDDDAAVKWVGRSSLGDIEIDAGATQLFVANLYNARIHRIALPGGELIGAFDHGARSETWQRRARLFALDWHDGWLYHGVMDAEEIDVLVPPSHRGGATGGPIVHVYRSRADGSELELVFATQIGLIGASVWGTAWHSQMPMIAGLEAFEDGRFALGMRNRRLDEVSPADGYSDAGLLPIGVLQVRAGGGLIIDSTDPTAGGALARLPGLAVVAMP